MDSSEVGIGTITIRLKNWAATEMDCLKRRSAKFVYRFELQRRDKSWRDADWLRVTISAKEETAVGACFTFEDCFEIFIASRALTVVTRIIDSQVRSKYTLGNIQRSIGSGEKRILFYRRGYTFAT